MCYFNQKRHISFVSMAMCAFCLRSDVNLVVFICRWPTVNASEQKTGIQDVQQSSFIRLCLLRLFLKRPPVKAKYTDEFI